MGFFGDIRGAAGGIDKKLLTSGVLARGRVIECRETAFSTGNTYAGTRQVCKVTVEISGLPGHEPYQATCRYPISIMYLAQMKTPGATVAVRVDPADPQNITLDLETDPPPASGAADPAPDAIAGLSGLLSGSPIANGIPVEGAVVVESHASDIKGPQILAEGTPCRAVIVQSMPLGVPDSQGLDATGFVLSVFVEGAKPYQVQIGVGVPPEAIPLVFPGANLPAKVMHDRPDLVAIDWEAALEASKHGPPV